MKEDDLILRDQVVHKKAYRESTERKGKGRKGIGGCWGGREEGKKGETERGGGWITRKRLRKRKIEKERKSDGRRK